MIKGRVEIAHIVPLGKKGNLQLRGLSHAVDDKLNGLKLGQQIDQEVTAEFSGAAIGYLMGYKIPFCNIKG